MVNHLFYVHQNGGTNVTGQGLATVSDMPIFDEGNNTIASVLSASDYYPFGLTMSGRGFKGEGYRFSFNEMEKDEDIVDNHLDFGARVYNAGIGRFLSGDSFSSKFPFQSPYIFAGNTPIHAINHHGDSIKVTYYWNNDASVSKIKITRSGKIIDLSSKNSVDLLSLKTALINKVESSFSDKVWFSDNPPIEFEGQFEITNSMSDIDITDHLLVIADWKSQNPYEIFRWNNSQSPNRFNVSTF